MQKININMECSIETAKEMIKFFACEGYSVNAEHKPGSRWRIEAEKGTLANTEPYESKEEETGNWQMCPLCEGEGGETDLSGMWGKYCSLCRGNRIINMATGLPPERHETGKQKEETKGLKKLYRARISGVRILTSLT